MHGAAGLCSAAIARGRKGQRVVMCVCVRCFKASSQPSSIWRDGALVEEVMVLMMQCCRHRGITHITQSYLLTVKQEWFPASTSFLCGEPTIIGTLLLWKCVCVAGTLSSILYFCLDFFELTATYSTHTPQKPLYSICMWVSFLSLRILWYLNCLIEGCDGPTLNLHFFVEAVFTEREARDWVWNLQRWWGRCGASPWR